MEKKKTWVVRAVNLPMGLDELIEKTRVRVGFSRSRFYATALTEYLRSLSVISEAVKERSSK